MSTGKLLHPRALNAVLRLIPMAAKLGLTLYIGRYLSLEAMGTYGLVFGAVMLLGPLMGQGFGYIVARDIVSATPVTVLHKMRDQALLYAANYLILGIAVMLVIVGGRLQLSTNVLWFIVVLTALEGLGTASYFNMNSLHQQVWANAMFCIRSGLWVLFVVGAGLIEPSLRTVNFILGGWVAGSAISLVATLMLWRHMPWKRVTTLPIDWTWMGSGLKKSCLVWLGAVGLAAGTYVDRFVVEQYLSLSDVGVITFYASFTNALLALMQSGVLAFATPRMIQHHRDGNGSQFDTEAYRAAKQVSLGAGGAVLVLAAVVPILGMLTGRAALVDNAPVLWLMLAGSWVRAVAEVLYNILYARHQDRAIWLGNILFLIPAIGGNIVFIPIIGLKGVGVSALIAALCLCGWRLWHIRKR